MAATGPVDVAELVRQLAEAAQFDIGFPGATDFDYTVFAPLLGRLLNNVGDPFVEGAGHNHTKRYERLVVGFVAELMGAPAGDWWGYVTTGGTEGNLYGLYAARTRYPDTIVYVSAAAHDSVHKALDLLGLPRIVVGTLAGDEMDYGDLSEQVQAHRERPVTVVATAGTTMAEGVDDVATIRATLTAAAMETRSFIHVDGALSGLPLALLPPESGRPGIGFPDGADTITVSAHKFVGSPWPAGVVVTRKAHRALLAREGSYTGSPDVTIGGSRSGHAPLVLWYAIQHHGPNGLRRRAEASRELARYTHDQLTGMPWPSLLSRWGFTVRLQTPPAAVGKRWVLADGGNGWSHLICMPGVTRERIDAFLSDMRAAIMSSAHIPIPRRDPDWLPAPA